RLSLLPRKSEFFTLFEQHAKNAVEAAEALERLFADFTDVENKVRDIHAIEHYGDKLNHEIVRHLNETFVTPLDREDIVGLGTNAVEASETGGRPCAGCTDVGNRVRNIRAATHYGDKLHHETERHLNETFVTPLAREDIVGLGPKIDAITDVCYDVAELVHI